MARQEKSATTYMGRAWPETDAVRLLCQRLSELEREYEAMRTENAALRQQTEAALETLEGLRSRTAESDRRMARLHAQMAAFQADLGRGDHWTDRKV